MQQLSNNSFDLEPVDMMNYKDFCGSQEWSFQLKKPSRETPYYQLGSKSSQSFNGRANDASNKPPKVSSSSTTFINSYMDEQETSNELSNFYNSSLISDYRLTLTDLIELNLIDISNGLIINPLNGRRLCIADAIRIDLLNSDVKEIANTFVDSANSCIKLTVKEAIKLHVLNPFRNEICLSASNANLTLNIHDARKRNMILKPLTLSEAFIRNLIQPNGFVRNPINNKYYAFDPLVTNDMEARHEDKKSDFVVEATSGELFYEQPLYYVFDFETKHIIDPNDGEKRILSLGEAIRCGLILPRTFEFAFKPPNRAYQQRINLYEAFFHSQHLNLSLLLYKPEIDNVYVKLTSNLFNKLDYFTASNSSKKQSKLGVVLSRRDKIGLIEAINLNVINLKHMTYSTVSEPVNLTTLNDAISKYELVDMEVTDLLNTPIIFKQAHHAAAPMVTLRDCINDFTIILEKCLIKNPFSQTNEYVLMDSYSGKALLSDELIKRIKRLVTRINVKSYIISLNSGVSSCSSTYSDNVSHSEVKQTSSFRQDKVVRVIKPVEPIANFYFGQQEQTEMVTSVWRSDSSVKSSGFIGTKELEKSLTIELKEQDMQDEEAILIEIGTDSTIKKPTISLRNHETSTVIIEAVKDAATGNSYSIDDAIKMNILDKTNLDYKNTLTGAHMSLNEALRTGLVMGNIHDERMVKDSKLLSAEKRAETAVFLTEREEKCFRIETVFNPQTKSYVSLEQAIREGIFDRAKGLFVEPLTGRQFNLNDAVKKGFVTGNFFKQQEEQDNKTSILTINVGGQTEMSVKPTDAVLYEVNEVQTVNFVALKDSRTSSIEERFEQVIEDVSEPQQEVIDSVRPRKRRENTGFRKNILERKIPSLCGSEHNLACEPLVINDVRQSAMLDINGVTHIFNNELHIESEPLDHGARKSSNRAVILVDDQLINGGNHHIRTKSIGVRFFFCYFNL